MIFILLCQTFFVSLQCDFTENCFRDCNINKNMEKKNKSTEKKNVYWIARDKNPNKLRLFRNKPKRNNQRCEWFDASFHDDALLSYKYPFVPWDKMSDVVVGFEDLTWNHEPIKIEINILQETRYPVTKEEFTKKLKKAIKLAQSETDEILDIRTIINGEETIWAIDDIDNVFEDMRPYLTKEYDIEIYENSDGESMPLDHGIYYDGTSKKIKAY